MTDIRVTGVLDNFDRANENPLSGGGNWDWNRWVDHPMQNFDNAAYGGVLNLNCASYWTPETFSGDMEVWATVIGNIGENNTGWYLGFGKELTSPTQNDGYILEIFNPVGADRLRIYRLTNDAITQIASAPSPFHIPQGPDKILLRRNGTSVEAWYSTDNGANWTMYCSAVDTTYTTNLNVFIGVDAGSVVTLHGYDEVGGGVATDFVPQIYRRVIP